MLKLRKTVSLEKFWCEYLTRAYLRWLIPNTQARDGTKNVPVGKIIALLAEEGDDISNLQPPAEEAKPEPTKQSAPPEPETPNSKPAPTPSTSTPSHSHKHFEHSRPFFPSVLRLLQEHNVDSLDKINGTGVRSMLTKGDILAHLGLASGPTGTFQEKRGLDEHKIKPSQKPEKAEPPLDGPAIRRLIVSNMLTASTRARSDPSNISFWVSIATRNLIHERQLSTGPQTLTR
jgi:pyruvate/2-oxoglutarate dehydrogenase complex dihydrolipoamide acyltransferase (E2) component